MKTFSLLLLFLGLSSPIWAQVPYAPAAGILGTSAMHKDSSAFVGWAHKCQIQRGWKDIAHKNLGKTTVGDSSNAFGKAGNAVVSLGDSGVAILQFEGSIYNGNGPDFAIFENGFTNNDGGDFLELAFVEVSSDGIHYYRFPAHSLSDTTHAVGSFGSVEPTKINNLAGKYLANYGTPFDLSDLQGINGLNIQKITHIKIVDVVGSLNHNYASRDTANRKINDPYPTAFPSGGFDLDAVGVVHLNPTGLSSNKRIKTVVLYPNPTDLLLHIPAKWQGAELKIYNPMGKEVKFISKVENILLMEELPSGFYFIHLQKDDLVGVTKVFRR